MQSQSRHVTLMFLKSSHHAKRRNFPPQLLLLVTTSRKCDNVLCSESTAISVHLAPNVSKLPRVLFWMNGRLGEEQPKRRPGEGSCLTACQQQLKASFCFKSLMHS